MAGIKVTPERLAAVSGTRVPVGFVELLAKLPFGVFCCALALHSRNKKMLVITSKRISKKCDHRLRVFLKMDKCRNLDFEN